MYHIGDTTYSSLHHILIYTIYHIRILMFMRSLGPQGSKEASLQSEPGGREAVAVQRPSACAQQRFRVLLGALPKTASRPCKIHGTWSVYIVYSIWSLVYGIYGICYIVYSIYNIKCTDVICLLESVQTTPI